VMLDNKTLSSEELPNLNNLPLIFRNKLLFEANDITKFNLPLKYSTFDIDGISFSFSPNVYEKYSLPILPQETTPMEMMVKDNRDKTFVSTLGLVLSNFTILDTSNLNLEHLEVKLLGVFKLIGCILYKGFNSFLIKHF
ncbi:MAG: hypothetical protein N3D81_03345, partial [Spirochaetes bacterium]|nr:hypothetical protein [Spirochaetota bacterium]